MPSRSVRGYTLIELLVVLAILSILVLAVGTGLGGAKQPGAVKATSGVLYGLLQEARTAASLRGANTAITTQGSTPADLQLSFLSADGANNTIYVRNGDGSSVFNYSIIDNGATGYYGGVVVPNPAPEATDGIKSILGGVTTLPPRLFTGSASTSLSFDPKGRPNASFYIAVIGARGSVAYADAPIALILLTPSNGIHTFYKSSASDVNQPWRRL